MNNLVLTSTPYYIENYCIKPDNQNSGEKDVKVKKILSPIPVWNFYKNCKKPKEENGQLP